MGKRLTLVLGGVRAGKSSYAQRLASEGKRVLFAASAEAGDEEMTARIQAHRAARPADWGHPGRAHRSRERADALAAPLCDMVLLDCLTIWVSNLLLRGEGSRSGRVDILSETKRLLELYAKADSTWIMVSNEVGLGVVPATQLGRGYADELGRVNQTVAAAADEVYFMAAGLPLPVKGREAGGGRPAG